MDTPTRSLISLTYDECLALFKAAYHSDPIGVFCHLSFPALIDGEMGRQHDCIIIDDDLKAIQLWSSGHIRAYTKYEEYEDFQVCTVDIRRVISYLDSLNIAFGDNPASL